MLKLHPQQKGEGGVHYVSGIVFIYWQTPDEKIIISFLFFIYYFSYFSYGEISTVRIKSSRFEFHRWASLGSSVGDNLIMRFLVIFTSEM